MNVFDFFGTGEQEHFNEIWEKVIAGSAFQGQLKMQDHYGEEQWFRATFLSATDMYGELEKVVFLASEITREKEMELVSRKSHDQLSRKEEELKMAGLDMQKKLEESRQKLSIREQQHHRELLSYTSLLNDLPFPMLSINNLGFVRFFNAGARRVWGLKEKDVLDLPASRLFSPDEGSSVISSFHDPALSKKTGLHKKQKIILANGTELQHDLLISSTDLGDEIHYNMVLL